MLTSRRAMKTISYDMRGQNQGNRALLDMLTNRAPGRALDRGCGAGDNARILVSRGWTVTGITVSKEESVAAAEFCERIYCSTMRLTTVELMEQKEAVVLGDGTARRC